MSFGIFDTVSDRVAEAGPIDGVSIQSAATIVGFPEFVLLLWLAIIAWKWVSFRLGRTSKRRAVFYSIALPILWVAAFFDVFLSRDYFIELCRTEAGLKSVGLPPNSSVLIQEAPGQEPCNDTCQRLFALPRITSVEIYDGHDATRNVMHHWGIPIPTGETRYWGGPVMQIRRVPVDAPECLVPPANELVNRDLITGYCLLYTGQPEATAQYEFIRYSEMLAYPYANIMRRGIDIEERASGKRVSTSHYFELYAGVTERALIAYLTPFPNDELSACLVTQSDLSVRVNGRN